MSEREQIMDEVSQWASNKRDGRIQGPDLVESAAYCVAWREGYKDAMNDAAQHFNMERLAARRGES